MFVISKIIVLFNANKTNFIVLQENCAAVIPTKSDSDVVFCLQSYQGLRIYRSIVY